MPLTFGAFGPLLIREEAVTLDIAAPVRLLYASDLHLGHWWTRAVPQRLLDAAASARPDVILLGGDLIDRLSALAALSELVQALRAIAPVAAVPGNHDERLGAEAVRRAIQDAQGVWLPDTPLKAPCPIDGVIADPPGRILCAHDPGVFPAAARAGYQLVLAGHLHGGQCVFSHRGRKQWPAAWFNRWHGERFSQDGAQMLVSRGAADTFPFRFNCPREVILCRIEPGRT